ncbi:MAG: HTH domain-containing protein [Planctomycetes bacterium]|nr:HTH domain-containing protein [Planctomycetota bacterium]
MPANMSDRCEFTETFAIHTALRAALKQKLFAVDPHLRKTAEKLVHAFESERTIYGRQLKMLGLMRKGTTIDTIRRKLRCSRRTVFRYLNHLESAGVEITLQDGVYRVTGKLVATLLK